MPGPPTSTSAVGDPAERNAPTSASSASRPISSVWLARGAAVEHRRGCDRVAVRRRALEAGILDEHAPLEVLQRRARVDPELVGERAPERLVARERLGLTARAVEREHLLRAKALAQRVTGDERLELAHHLGVATQREVGLDAPLERREPELLEASGLGVGERLRELGQRRPAPQRQRAPDEVGCVAGPAAGERGTAVRHESLEAVEVELAVGELEHVPGRTRVEPRLGQHLAELRDVDLHHLPRGIGDGLAPQVVDDPLPRDRPVRVQEQHGEQRPLLARRDRQRGGAVDDFERAQEAEFHRSRVEATPSRRGPPRPVTAALPGPHPASNRLRVCFGERSGTEPDGFLGGIDVKRYTQLHQLLVAAAAAARLAGEGLDALRSPHAARL